MPFPRTCVIGAGQAGLTAIKALKDRGVPVVGFEATGTVGGNWSFGNGHSSAYRSLHIDTPKNALAFRDLAMPSDWPAFLHHSRVCEYLNRYADAFGLRNQIRFNTRVQHAERHPGGGYTITAEGGESEEFDAVIVANGHHWDPRLPEPAFPGAFDGEAIHSHYYVDPTTPLDLHGKRVLVVGIGNSAADIAAELASRSVSDQTFISTRSGAWIVPLTLFGITLDRFAKPIRGVPLKLQRRATHQLLKRVIGSPEHYGLPKPDHRILEAHPTASQELLWRLQTGDLVARPNVKELQGDHVAFVDGSRERIDVIIYATGYRISFPFFDEDFISAPENRFPLFKRVFKPGVDDLAFIGLCQPIPTLFPFCERQSKWVADYLSGRYRLPPTAEMEATIIRDEKIQRGHYTDRPRHTMQADMHVYFRDMDKEQPAGAQRAGVQGPQLRAKTERAVSV